MSDYHAPLKDMRFALRHAAGLDRLAHLPGYGEAEPELVDQILEEAAKLARDVLSPINAAGDREKARFENGVVRMPAGFAEAYAAFVEGGWNGVPFDPDYGGQGLPWAIQTTLHEMWQAANLSFGLCPLLTQGAVEAIAQHGTDAVKSTYLPPLIEGRWTGTMNLTEPQAGSDVGALKTRAVPEGDHYRITGQKIYITYGDHDLAENIVHLVLARLPDAPAGTKGISLFLVPKFLPDEAGRPGRRNDVRCVSIEDKLGIHASPTCVMSYGDEAGAIGYLLGEENRGMACMFTMMNNARLGVGLQGVAIAERAYQHALDYARQRVQSREIGGSDGPVAIINHPDVRRMLLGMKTQAEAGRWLAYHTAAMLDHAHRNPDPAERAKAQTRLDLLTPIVKAWATDFGVDVASTGIQVHGGMGYVEETGAAQHLRDARICPIYEGTNTIQANDLVFRKVARDGGAAMRAMIAEMRDTLARLETTPGDALSAIQRTFRHAINALESATGFIVETAPVEPRVAAAGAVPYLTLAGTTAGGWLMATGALAAAECLKCDDADHAFCEAKIADARFYAEHVLPRASGELVAITEGGGSVLALDEAVFG